MIDLEHLDLWQSAKDYVDKQLAVMEKYGSRPELSAARYHALIDEVLKTTLELRARRK